MKLLTDKGLVKGSWSLKLLFGRGAGYIGGFSFYIGRRLVGGGRDMYRPSGFRIGLTRNANLVPWLQH